MARTQCSHGPGYICQFCWDETNKSNDPWNNLKVGEFVGKNTIRGVGYGLEVVEITENLIALKDGDVIKWHTKTELKENYSVVFNTPFGWTIKDTTPKEEKKEEDGVFLHIKSSDYETIPCPDNKPGCLVVHYKPRINKNTI